MPELYRIRFTLKAETDLLECADSLARRSNDPWIARVWYLSILQHIQRLELFPDGYPPFSILPYRKLIHSPYLVMFRIDNVAEEVLVCRVFHGARLLENVGPTEP